MITAPLFPGFDGLMTLSRREGVDIRPTLLRVLTDLYVQATAHSGDEEQQFVELREARDRTLPMPKLILHALQINVRAGRLPEPEGNGKRYLKFPLDALAGAAWSES